MDINQILKATWANADLVSEGGLLNVEQSDRFIDYILDAPTMLPRVRTPRMNSPSSKINRLNMGGRILQEAQSAVCPDGVRPQSSIGMELNTKEYIARVDLPYDVIEDNIMRGNIGRREGHSGTEGNGEAGGGIVDMVMRLIAQQVALDIEELALLGDTASGDAYLASQDGWLKLASTHVVDGGGAPLSGALLTEGLGALPSVYQRQMAQLRHFVSWKQRIAYGAELGARQTALGDAATTSNLPLLAQGGTPVDGTPIMPEDKGLFTMLQNLVIGFQRNIHIETDKEICQRVHRIVVTCRLAVGIDDVNGAVSYTNLG